MSKHDAEVVDVIHTNGYYEEPYIRGNYYGTLIPLGTIDFYPNWGNQQPGTGYDNTSHARAVELFMWSISNKGAFKTSQYLVHTPTLSVIRKETAQANEVVEMGFYFNKSILRTPGRCYYVKTRERIPWV